MSFSRLCTRVARLEARPAPALPPVVVVQWPGHTRDAALLAAGSPPEEVAGWRIIVVQYEETRPDAFTT